jgi:hypothetical protein
MPPAIDGPAPAGSPKGAGAPGEANIVEVKRSIAHYIECMHEQIMPETAESAADWIMERIETSFQLVPLGSV